MQTIAAHFVELYSDEFALLPAMHCRWGSELGEATARARFAAMIGSEELGNRAADRMAQARFFLGASVAAGPAIEAHTRDLLAALCRHFEAAPYLLGGRQSFADCALMGPLDGHLFNDIVCRRLLLETAAPVVGWIERCRFPNEDTQGEWLTGDALAPSFVEVLAAMGRDAAPVLRAGVRSVDDWAEGATRVGAELPRAVGVCQATLRGVPIERGAMPYSLYSFQQVRDRYRAFAAADRARIDAVLADTGWPELLAGAPRHRVVKDGFQLTLARIRVSSRRTPAENQSAASGTSPAERSASPGAGSAARRARGPEGRATPR